MPRRRAKPRFDLFLVRVHRVDHHQLIDERFVEPRIDRAKRARVTYDHGQRHAARHAGLILDELQHLAEGWIIERRARGARRFGHDEHRVERAHRELLGQAMAGVRGVGVVVVTVQVDDRRARIGVIARRDPHVDHAVRPVDAHVLALIDRDRERMCGVDLHGCLRRAARDRPAEPAHRGDACGANQRDPSAMHTP